jgi:hypothetical protein
VTEPVPTLEQLYDPLCLEAVWAHAKWDVFEELYATEGRLELLRVSAAGFFSILQDVLFDDVLLAISRLTDPRGFGNRENLTLDHLGEYLGRAGLTTEQTRFEAILAQLRIDAAAIRTLRNKVLSHRDLAAALAGGRGIAAIRATEVRVALRHLADALNLFERAVGKPVYQYREFIHTESHRRLLLQLKKALAYDAHVKSGKIQRGEDDLSLPSLKS